MDFKTAAAIAAEAEECGFTVNNVSGFGGNDFTVSLHVRLSDTGPRGGELRYLAKGDIEVYSLEGWHLMRHWLTSERRREGA